MRFSRRNVSVIVVAVVLASTGGVGLLLRQASRGPRPPVAADPGIRQQQLTVSQQRPGGRDTQETRADRAKRQKLRAQELEKMASLTEEEKARFRAQIREQFSSRTAHAAQAQREKAWRDQRAAGAGSVSYPEHLPAGTADANATQENPGDVTAEPNQAGQR
jgi:hypothetical protein